MYVSVGVFKPVLVVKHGIPLPVSAQVVVVVDLVEVTLVQVVKFVVVLLPIEPVRLL